MLFALQRKHSAHGTNPGDWSFLVIALRDLAGGDDIHAFVRCHNCRHGTCDHGQVDSSIQLRSLSCSPRVGANRSKKMCDRLRVNRIIFDDPNIVGDSFYTLRYCFAIYMLWK